MPIADFLPHTFTGYTNGNLVISVSSTIGSPYFGWKVADGINIIPTPNAADNGWFASAMPAYWKIDMGAGASWLLDNYDIKVTNYNGAGLKDWTVQGSNDDITYFVLDTVTGQTWTSYQYRNYVCDVRTTGYRYFKINVTAVTTWTTLGELYLNGSAVVADAPQLDKWYKPIVQPTIEERKLLGY